MISTYNIKSINRNSDILALFIAETLICSMIGAVISIPYISVIATLALIFAALCVNKDKLCINVLSETSKFLIVLMLLIISGAINGLGSVLNYLLNFICFGVASVYFSSMKTDVKRVFKTLGKIYFIYVVFYLLIMRRTFIGSSNYWERQMGIAYGFVAIVLLGIIAILFNKSFAQSKKEKLFIFIFSGAALLLMLLDTGTRGAIVCVAIGFVIAFLSKQSTIKKILLILLVSIVAILCLLYYREILIFVADMLDKFGIRIGAIDKMLFMVNQNNESNGRDVLYAAASEYFINSPIIGHGIGFFEKNQSMYAHNIFWQLLCEYGIIGLTIALVLLVVKIRSIYSRKIGIPKYLVMFLFCSSVPMLLFSNTYWLLPHFWLLFFYNGKNNVDISSLSAETQEISVS